MTQAILPAWYYPTTVIFIDDNLNFLKQLLFNIDMKQITPKLISDSLKASQFLKTLPHESRISKQLASAELKSHEGLYTNIDEILSSFHQGIEQSDRFHEVSLVAIDYAMPGRNGLEICSELRDMNSGIKILLLTGEASADIGVEAFNDGKIDKFMRKDASDFKQKLNHEIQLLQNAYFQGITNSTLNRLDIEPENPIAPCLKDPVFIRIFQDICEKNNIVEHYLFNSDGSFLLIDYNGNPMLLAVKDERMMEDAYQVALNASDSFPSSLLEAMENYQQILCLYEDVICENPRMAKKFLHPAEKLVGEKTYYYALIKDLKNYPFSNQKIFSFKDYAANVNPY